MADKQHVITRKYSQYYDMRSEVQFTEILDQRRQLKIGHAYTEVDFSSRAGFEVISDQEYARIISGEPVVLPAQPVTGDPIGDLAARAQADADAKAKADADAAKAQADADAKAKADADAAKAQADADAKAKADADAAASQSSLLGDGANGASSAPAKGGGK